MQAINLLAFENMRLKNIYLFAETDHVGRKRSKHIWRIMISPRRRACWGATVCRQIKSCDKIFDGTLQVLCGCHRAWGGWRERRATPSAPQTSILTGHHDCQAYWRDRNSNEPLLHRDKTTWVLVKDELWLFLENEVLGLATGQTLNSQGWNYLKRGTGWCTWHLSLKECLLFTTP